MTPDAHDREWSDDDRRRLLRLARAVLEDALGSDGRSLTAARADIDPSGPLGGPRATFVTLRTSGAGGRLDLRGCIGTLEATEPLHRSVESNARRAAFHDPRFPPLEQDELDRLRISISVLSPSVLVDRCEAIVPGRDGVRVEFGGRRGVFLPEVAREHGWDREELLGQLAIKAGIREADLARARLWTFRSESFGE